VALTAITVGLLGVFSLIARSMAVNRLVSERHIATYLAAEGVELIKNLIDKNYIQLIEWNEGLSVEGDYEIDYKFDGTTSLPSFANNPLRYDDTSGFYSYDSGSTTKYKRKIIISYPANSNWNQMKVNSIVTWEGKGDVGARTVNLEDRFFNWR